MSSLSLFGKKRFSGIFWTQSVGAFTDSFFKQTLLALVAHRGLQFMGMSEETLSQLAGAIFMAPYFFLSATAGQLADKFDKAGIIRRLKALEILFAVIAALAIYFQNMNWCVVSLIFFAIQSSFFGPLKYGILPQLLEPEELVAGNAWVETSTNLFILVGTILGTEFITRNVPDVVTGGLLVAISLLGLFFSTTIPEAPGNTSVKVDWNPFVPTWQTIVLVGQKRSILNSILGISWFWALGMVMLGAFPVYTTKFLQCNLEVSTLLFVVFSIGVALGSVLCERLSFGRLELGLVPIGSIGISLFLALLWLLGNPLPAHDHPLSGLEFIQTGGGIAIAICVLLFCLFSGFFIVPLYTLIQQRSDADTRARVIAGNNIVNAFFMVIAAGLTAVAQSKLHLTYPQIFGALAIVNLVVSVYIYTLIPEFTVRFIAYLITHFLYRLKVVGEDKIPAEGPVVLIANHVSFVDWLIVMASVKRPVHFVMWYTYFNIPGLRFLFKGAGVIPISSARLRPKILAEAFVSIKRYLDEGEVICIFPEGTITKTGELNKFRNGVEKIVELNPVPVVPMALKGLWGGNFSRYKGGFFSRFTRRPLRSKIEVIVGDPIAPEDVKADDLQNRVAELGGDKL
ncbi:MAG: MFS transporter [Candidatus Eremiobacteraeota bacterium]|nr:MFS transporter [Candidatus Eremiobacteraeota bacterium]